MLWAGSTSRGNEWKVAMHSWRQGGAGDGEVGAGSVGSGSCRSEEGLDSMPVLEEASWIESAVVAVLASEPGLGSSF